MKVLTTYACGRLEDLVYLRIHLDVEISLLGHLLGALLQLLVHPVFEIIADQGINDVGNVPSVETIDLSRLLRQRLGHFRVLPGPAQHIGLSQPCEEGDVDMVNIFAHYQSSGATNYVPQMEDRHRLVSVQVRADLGGKEAEAFRLTRKALTELR